MSSQFFVGVYMSSKPTDSNSQSNDPASMGTQASAVLARLDALEKELKATQEENARLKAEAEQSMAAGLRYSPNEKAFAGPEGYEFLVIPKLTPDNRDKFSHLKEGKVTACDESEAKRWYYQSNETKPGSGTAVDPMAVRLEVKCLSKSRNESLRRQQQLAGLRAKVEAGTMLSKAEETLLSQYEADVFRI